MQIFACFSKNFAKKQGNEEKVTDLQKEAA